MKTITLPSGREVTIKPMGFYELHRLNRALPDLRSVKDGESPGIDQELAAEQMIRTVLMCVVKPKFWIDLRDEDDINSKPLACPQGWTELDLSAQDMGAAFEAISALSDLGGQRDNVTPLSKTGTD